MFFWSTDPLPPARHNNFTGWNLFWVAITLIKSLCYAIRFHDRRNGYAVAVDLIESAAPLASIFHLFCSPLLSLGALKFRLWVALLNRSFGSEFWKAENYGFLEPMLLILCLVLTLIQILLDNSQSKPWAAQPTASRSLRGGVKAICET